MKTVLYWLRNDLRIHDNIILSSRLNSNDRLLPLYIFDKKLNEKHILGFNKVGTYRKKFLLQTLSDLKTKYQNLLSNLLIKFGDPENIIPELVYKYKIDVVYGTKEHTREEIEAEKRVIEKLNNIPFKFFEQLTLVHPDHLPFRINEVPDIFTIFRKEVEKRVKIRSPFSIPDKLPSLPDEFNEKDDINIEAALANAPNSDTRSAFKFLGGETEGMKRLDEYVWKTRLIKNYKNTRNGMIGENYSSKFSPWLSIGALSPRMVYNEVKKFEREVTKNISTYWLIFELLWRDYFRFIAMKYGDDIFKKSGIKGVHKTYANKTELFEKWKLGETGNDFIDANMMELNLTGFMSNRGRQNVASYLVHDMDIDWRWGAAYFESMLIDYDVCSNWGNWMYVAGVGNDPRPNRKFNISLQAKKYDLEYHFRDLWLTPQLFEN